MILDDTVEVTISNQGSYYRSLGYRCKQGDKLTVKVSELKQNSNTFVRAQCDRCFAKWSATFQSLNKQATRYDRHLCFGCSRFDAASRMDYTNVIAARQKATGSKHPRWNPNKAEFAEYAYRVRRLTEQTYCQHIDQINPERLPRTLCGVSGGYQLDHKQSILSGFNGNVDPALIAAVDNLQMLEWQANRQKAA